MPLNFEWRLRIYQISSVGIHSSSVFRTIMKTPTNYFVEKSYFHLFLIANQKKLSSIAEDYIEKEFNAEPFYKKKRTNKEIDKFVSDKREPLILRNVITSYFSCNLTNTKYGKILPKTNLLCGLDATSNCFQLQQISILSSTFDADLNFTASPEIGDLHMRVINEYMTNLKKQVRKDPPTSLEIEKCQQILKNNAKKRMVIAIENETNKAFTIESKEISDDYIRKIIYLPESYIRYEVLQVLDHEPQSNLRKYLKGAIVAFAYNANTKSTLLPLRTKLRDKVKNIKYKNYLCEYILTTLRNYLFEMDLLLLNKLFSSLVRLYIRNKIPFTWYHLSGALITPHYKIRETGPTSRVFITVTGPRVKRKLVKSCRRNITLSSKVSSDWKRLSTSTSPNWTHSLDSAILHHVALKYNYIFCIHDCFLIKLKDYKTFYTDFPKYLYDVFLGIDPAYNIIYPFKNSDPEKPLLDKYYRFFVNDFKKKSFKHRKNKQVFKLFDKLYNQFITPNKKLKFNSLLKGKFLKP